MSTNDWFKALSLLGGAGVFGLFLPKYTIRRWEFNPETEDSLKHRIKHRLFGIPAGWIVRYDSANRQEDIGLQCAICEKFSDVDAPPDPNWKETAEQKDLRLRRKDFYTRWGPKDTLTFQSWMRDVSNPAKA